MLPESLDLSALLKALFVALYVLLLVVGLAMCFWGPRVATRWKRTVYFIALFVLTNIVVLPVCWILFKFMAGTNDKVAIGALALLSTLLAWRVSGLREATIIQVYGTMIGALAGVVVGSIVGFATPSTWAVHVSLWLAGGVLGWWFARKQPAFSSIVFFAASGAATATQSLLGLYEIATGRSIQEVSIAKTVQLLFPIVYVIFSSGGLIEFLFWIATFFVFMAGVRAQCARHRVQMPETPALCDRFDRVLPAIGTKVQRLIGRS